MEINRDDCHIYLNIYRQIRLKARGNFIDYATVLEIVKRNLAHTQPKALFFPTIKTFEKLKLLKRIDKKRYEVIGGTADAVLNQLNYPI